MNKDILNIKIAYNYILNKYKNYTLKKNKKAKELGIPIISESELKEKYFNWFFKKNII